MHVILTLQMREELADENATLRGRLAHLEARDKSRDDIESIYAKLVAAGILDPEEEDGTAAGTEEGEGESEAESGSAAEEASKASSGAEEPDPDVDPEGNNAEEDDAEEPDLNDGDSAMPDQADEAM